MIAPQPPYYSEPNPERPARAEGCTCDCHEYDIAHVAPCCAPTEAESKAWYNYGKENSND